MKQEFTIRSSIQSDEDCVEEIVNLSFPRFFRFFANRSLNSEGPVLVSEAEGKVVGFAKLIEFKIGGDRFGCVLWLAVNPNFRQRNVATGLVDEGTDYLLANGVGAVFASTLRSNLGSLATFRKAGFRRMGFLDLWKIFGWRVFSFYMKTWYAPGEVMLMRSPNLSS